MLLKKPITGCTNCNNALACQQRNDNGISVCKIFVPVTLINCTSILAKQLHCLYSSPKDSVGVALYSL